MVYLYSLLTAISTVDNKCDKLYPSWCVTLFLSVTVNVKHVTPMLCEQHRNVSEAGVSKRTWKTICEIICINASSVRHWKHLPYCAVHLTCEMLMLHIKVTNYPSCCRMIGNANQSRYIRRGIALIVQWYDRCTITLWCFHTDYRTPPSFCRHNTYYEYEAVPTT